MTKHIAMLVNSKQRPDKVKVLDTVLSGFNRDSIMIFVEPEELKSYKASCGARAVVIGIGERDRGNGFVRHFMQKWCEQNGVHAAWFIDDTVAGLNKRTEKNAKGYWKTQRLTTSKEIREAFEDMSRFMLLNRFGQLGVSFQGSNYLVDDEYKSPGRNWKMFCNNIPLLKRNNCYFDPEQVLFSDFGLACELLTNGLRVAQDYRYAFDSPRMNSVPGGCRMFRTKQGSHDSAMHMVKRYGERFVKIYYDKTHDMYEMKIAWKKLMEYGRNRSKGAHEWW